LPAIVHAEDQPILTRSEPGPIALVLAPTRELAVQICDEAYKLLRHSYCSHRHRDGIRTAVIYGGGRKRDQLRMLTHEGVHILVATPGRLLDFVGDCRVSLHRVTYFVLDEADRMLDLGFAGDVKRISSHVRPERHALFFSATWASQVQSMACEFCSQNPVRIRVGGQTSSSDCADHLVADEPVASDGVTQQVIVVDFPGEWKKAEAEKRDIMEKYIREALSANDTNKILVFVNQKALADELSLKLCEEGFRADCIHGGRNQDTRLWVLDEFRKGRIRLLVATDVIGRGIDILNISHVIVFEMGSVQDYVHRIGRTGRGPDGKGHALVFFEYYYKNPQNASDFIRLLERSKQHVPDELRRIAEEVKTGKRMVEDISTQWEKSYWDCGSSGRWGWGNTAKS